MSIYHERKKAKRTQYEVADAMGVSVAAVSYWEQGKAYPRASTLKRLAEYFGCTVDDLLREDEE